MGRVGIEPGEPSEEDYLASERVSDRMLGLWFLVLIGAGALGGLLSWATGLEIELVMWPVMVVCVVIFLLWARSRTRNLLPQRKAVRWEVLARRRRPRAR